MNLEEKKAFLLFPAYRDCRILFNFKQWKVSMIVESIIMSRKNKEGRNKHDQENYTL